jgi:DNA-binding NarL/FixJ family response regulator
VTRTANHSRPIPTGVPQVALTPRERDVVRGIALGRTNREMARELGISHQAIKNLVSSVYRKCVVRNRIQLALYAERCHLLGSDRESTKKE